MPPDLVIPLSEIANHPRDPRYEVLDGIIETDWWLGPIVTPIRLRKTELDPNERKKMRRKKAD